MPAYYHNKLEQYNYTTSPRTIRFVESFSSNPPEETQFLFKSSLEWETKIPESAFKDGYTNKLVTSSFVGFIGGVVV